MTTSNNTAKLNTGEMDIEEIFKLQKYNQQKIADTTSRERKQKLGNLQKALFYYRQEIRDALYKDFRKHKAEVDIAEIYPVSSAIKFARRHLSKWMRPKRAGVPMAQLGTSSYIHHEPKGVVLIISPWNFPVNLTFGPLVSAIAAGNCVIIKPSEHTPHALTLMKKIVNELFDESEVALIEGDIEVATQLLKLPFNHIFFTGSPEVGKIVMKAAAENLSSITLELGGKSPVIVDKTANLNDAAMRIAFGKWINNGQVCIAPDYLFVEKEIADDFLDKLKKSIKSFYGEDAAFSESYNRIVDQKHFKRVESYFDEALSKGAKVEIGGRKDPLQEYFEPTIMTNIPENSALSETEIFGPILPFYTFTKMQEVIDKINTKEKPLALYIYSKSKKNIKKIIQNTRAGGTCINHNGIHFFNHNLPFGGINNSGFGKANGFFGFEAFSNQRGVLKQWAPVSALDLMSPPYNKFKQKLIDFSLKWL